MKSSLFLSSAIGLAAATGVLGAATATSAASVTCPGATPFEFFGVNESGAEFGNTVIPGTLGTDNTWPQTTSIDVSATTLMSSIS